MTQDETQYWPVPDAVEPSAVVEVPREDVVIGKRGEVYWKGGNDR